MRIDYETAFDRCVAINDEWNSMQSAEIASGRTPEAAWWAVYQSPRGKELSDMGRIAEFDKVRAGFQYDAVMLAAKALIALKEVE